jgi:hypothetical protein
MSRRNAIEVGLTHVPLNGTAARVTSKGFQYKPDKKINAAHWREPPPTKKFPSLSKNDLTGIKFGRFTVVGYLRDMRKRWLVRCVCGAFESRTAKAIRNPKNEEDRCQICRHTAHLRKRGSSFGAATLDAISEKRPVQKGRA